jgi:hypothetical protein
MSPVILFSQHRSATIESTLASPGGQEAGGGERQMPAL